MKHLCGNCAFQFLVWIAVLWNQKTQTSFSSFHSLCFLLLLQVLLSHLIMHTDQTTSAHLLSKIIFYKIKRLIKNGRSRT
ncbi:hypothetical protein EUGRSUZ_E01505 [Eucalyptus grandis]|uniref:Uncharacterized protein n=2 Tax=Eucalyptus grandis TaxID=71139 RepID=A0A059C498_EUCGR|nr:hypothetical protein EUGRSUZ_E01505 [Eucalyptus grandis]